MLWKSEMIGPKGGSSRPLETVCAVAQPPIRGVCKATRLDVEKEMQHRLGYQVCRNIDTLIEWLVGLDSRSTIARNEISLEPK